MMEKPTPPTELAPAAAAETPPEAPQAVPERVGPTVPAPHKRSPDIDRKIRLAVEHMLEDTDHPYLTVIIASREARRINAQRVRARSILNQAVEQIEEIAPEVPFVPRPVGDDVPEIKPTSESLEKMACGLIEYTDGEVVAQTRSFYEGEIDFDLFPEDDEEEGATEGSEG